MPRSLLFLYADEELENAISERLAPVFAAAALTATKFNVLCILIEGADEAQRRSPSSAVV